MINCDRCGAELFDFFHGDIFHSHKGEKEHFNLCPDCKRQFDSFLDGYDIIYVSDKANGINIPDNYNILKGDKD